MAREGWHFLVRITTLTSPKYLSGKCTYLSGSCRGIPAVACCLVRSMPGEGQLAYYFHSVAGRRRGGGRRRQGGGRQRRRRPEDEPPPAAPPAAAAAAAAVEQGAVRARLTKAHHRGDLLGVPLVLYFINMTCGYVSEYINSSTEHFRPHSVHISGCSWHGIGSVPHKKVDTKLDR